MREPHHPATPDLQLAHVLHALSDPLRLCIVQRVAEGTDGPCCQLASTVAKSTLSHHLRVLREAGILRVTVDGTMHRTCLRRDDLEQRFPGVLESILRVTDTG